MTERVEASSQGESRRDRVWTDEHCLRLLPGDEVAITETVALRDDSARDALGRRVKAKGADGKPLTSKRHVHGIVEALMPTVQRNSSPPFFVYRGFTPKVSVRVLETRGEPPLAAGETLMFMQINSATATRRVRRLDGSGPADREAAWREAFVEVVDARHEALRSWKPLRDELSTAIAADGRFKGIREALEWLVPESARLDVEERYWRGRWAGSFMCGSAVPDEQEAAIIRAGIEALRNRPKEAA
ncbi:hypothetical protein SAMN06297251_10154 [Fulvimarina manganoxydans]|uniref:Uncharacterized protein n=1 Tax=Fulvimarina manganoxydans TaxID=937218 RepID=A0A1W1Y8X4_9HYPH|nr:hypothetical protein [Fulvimarina manganoxydans]SMC32603.1 hypothetical protein SAMN06297251_10154 [Fulvimarina manganoxydans]